MNSFVNAINNQPARTANNMAARQSTANPCVDLFYKIGASRGKDICPEFYAAFAQSEDVALRILQWARDVRGGAGERELFRQILISLESTDPEAVYKLLPKIPDIGRWDDLLIFTHPFIVKAAYTYIYRALLGGNGLCAKWMPRKGIQANKLRYAFGWSPKRYRKTLVELTNVVETPMCANNWNEIDFEKVPSLASARYKKAFDRHSVHFEAYAEAAAKGEAKINAGAVYPYDVLKTVIPSSYVIPSVGTAEANHIRAQWAALPNLMGDAKAFPMVDVSRSMTSIVSGTLTAMKVAISLGLYMADKNTGVFKDSYLTFSEQPRIEVARGDIISKVRQLHKANWDMNTNLIRAFQAMLDMAILNRVTAKDMPEILVILSDMQFDKCARYDDSAMQSIERNYTEAGYKIPKIVFWNLDASDNVPVKYNKEGVALVSGFSPFIMKSVLSNDLEQFTPENIMLKTVMIDRYKLN